MRIKIGCAGWSVPKFCVKQFPVEGSHLSRYSQVLSGVEINSCFYRYHKAETYARWAAETPADFRFALKVPQLISHELRLINCQEPWERFQMGFERLGSKRGPILLQLPPSFSFVHTPVEPFLKFVRTQYEGPLICEPRHKSWFSPAAEECLQAHEVGRVGADPALLPEASQPLGAAGLLYYRLHGSPVMYESAYAESYLQALADELLAAEDEEVWCMFDNTTYGFATVNALTLLQMLDGDADRGKKYSSGESHGLDFDLHNY